MKKKIESFTGYYAFLSNFYPSIITVAGIAYPTVEHAFQAAKTYDLEKKNRIAAMRKPAQAKRFGKNLELRSNWETAKIGIMKDLLIRKFNGTWFTRRLIKTATAELIEGNVWGDVFWGMCNGRGKNRLGKILMDIRTVLIRVKRKRQEK